MYLFLTTLCCQLRVDVFTVIHNGHVQGMPVKKKPAYEAGGPGGVSPCFPLFFSLAFFYSPLTAILFI